MVFAIDEAADLLLATGFRKPLTKLQVADRAMIKSSLLDYYCLLKVKAEIDQFSEGLEDLGLLAMMKRQPSLFKPLFVCNDSACLLPGKCTRVTVIKAT